MVHSYDAIPSTKTRTQKNTEEHTHIHNKSRTRIEPTRKTQNWAKTMREEVCHKYDLMWTKRRQAAHTHTIWIRIGNKFQLRQIIVILPSFYGGKWLYTSASTAEECTLFAGVSTFSAKQSISSASQSVSHSVIQSVTRTLPPLHNESISHSQIITFQ